MGERGMGLGVWGMWHTLMPHTSYLIPHTSYLNNPLIPQTSYPCWKLGVTAWCSAAALPAAGYFSGLCPQYDYTIP